MKKTIKLFVFILLAFISSNSLQAQNDPGSADSVQRKLMKDSLSLNDQVITQVLAIRAHYLTESERIAKDSLYTEEQRDSLIAALIGQTNEGIKILMGVVVYEKYNDMIKRRLKNRKIGNQIQPLASQSTNN